ncbi:P pilus assembly protein, chaperone PapD [Pseudomonas sp. NFIX51]|uniref:fimbrial biogenesis chaperone n=1 Tax=unclassified Pseudomonas TaxID=196821 RepID=UPI0008D2B789|nr:P pilus assembly protein, chaperone PapD [Pseudomonas sp. NFACC41-3]SMH33482.1 P pilus assembly protein, chaperone PapD [Pseudomonas sp. NFIX51]
MRQAGGLCCPSAMARWICGSLMAAWLLMSLCVDAQAALAITGTRFIYPANTPAVTVRVGNTGDAPILLQAWLDRGDTRTDPSRLTVPFVLSPPISRLDPQQRSALVVRYTGEPLPGDRESVFWINFLEVPPVTTSDSNVLRLAYRMRMKLLYRPSGLAGKADEAIGQVVWSLDKTPGVDGQMALLATSRAPYYVSIPQLELGSGAQSISWQGITLEPFGTTRIALPATKKAAVANATVVRYQVAIDSGETLSGSARLQQ